MGETIIGFVRAWGRNFLHIQTDGGKRFLLDGPVRSGEPRLGIAGDQEEQCQELEREFAQELKARDANAEARYEALHATDRQS